jgi:hypothetical protein
MLVILYERSRIGVARQRLVRRVLVGGGDASGAVRRERSQRGASVRPGPRQGDVAARPQGGDRRSHVLEAHAGLIAELLAKTSDQTLMELRDALAERGVTTTHTSLWRSSPCPKARSTSCTSASRAR